MQSPRATNTCLLPKIKQPQAPATKKRVDGKASLRSYYRAASIPLGKRGADEKILPRNNEWPTKNWYKKQGSSMLLDFVYLYNSVDQRDKQKRSFGDVAIKWFAAPQPGDLELLFYTRGRILWEAVFK